MRFVALGLALMVAVPGLGHAVPIAMPVPEQGLLCRAAIDSAERTGNIPPHLLAAIGRVESGRRDPVTGNWHPWPWTVNAEGQGYFYDTKAQAIAAVQQMQSRGLRSIDVGCAQVNLMHHPDAFPNLEIAFDPQANANYAARFLNELHAQSGDWTKAAALYHSATPDLGDDYQRRVMAVWPEESRLAGSFPATTSLERAWSATLGAVPRTFGLGRAPRMIMLPTMAGSAQIGRSLATYRAAPISLAFQPPPRRPRLQVQ